MKHFYGMAIMCLALMSGCCGGENEVSAYSEPTAEMKTQMQNYEAQATTQLPNAER